MASTSTISAEEFRLQLKGIRSLSGCISLARTIDRRDLDTENSAEKIILLTKFLQKLTHFGEVDLEELLLNAHLEDPALIRSFMFVLTSRAGQYIQGTADMIQGEQDARKALVLARILQDGAMEGNLLNHLGNSLMAQRQLEEARDCFQSSVILERKRESNEGIARSLYNLSRTHLALGAYQDALDAVNEGLELYDSDASMLPYGKAFFLGVRQDIHEHFNLQGEALADAIRSLDIFQELKMTDRLCAAHFNLVRRYIKLDLLTEALDHALAAQAVAAQTGNPVDKIATSLSLCTIYIRFGELDTAQKFGREGLMLARETKYSAMETSCLERLGEIAWQRGDFQESEALLYEALKKESAGKKKIDLHRTIASHLLEQGNVEAARHQVQQGFSVLSESIEAEIDLDLLLVSARVAQMEGLHSEAIAILLSIVANEGALIATLLEAHRMLSKLYESCGDTANALVHYQQFHNISIASEKRHAEHHLVVLRTQHEIANHRQEVQSAKNIQEEVTKQKENLALIVAERQQVIEQVRYEVETAMQSIEQRDVKTGEHKLKEALRLLRSVPPLDSTTLHHLPNLDQDFFIRLREQFPTLTNGQLKLCGLLRSGLSSSEIAQHLHVSIATVTTQRKRLRKRMNLQEGTKLEEVLLNI